MMEMKIGRSTPMNDGTRGVGEDKRPPPILPSMTNSKIGKTNVPIAPSGSRRKILVSSQVSFQNPAFNLFRGASPLGLPYTLSRAPLRRRAPIAWLARFRSLASFIRRCPASYDRMECPVRRRNTSSSVGDSVRKSITGIACCARHWMTCDTSSSPLP